MPSSVESPLLLWCTTVKSFFSDRGSALDDWGLGNGDVFEGVAVQYFVRLVPSLGHFSELVRSNTVRLLVRLAEIFAPAKLRQRSTALHLRVVMEKLGQSRTMHQGIHQLFQLIGRSLAPVAVAVVSDLEAFFFHPDINVQDITVTVISRLVHENLSIFSKEGRLSVVWNLLFLLDVASPPGAVGGTGVDAASAGRRVATCEALALLAPIYAVGESAVAKQVVNGMLKFPNKTESEVESLRAGLGRIFREMLRDGSSEGGDDDDASLAETVLLDVLLGLLTAHNEFHYDELEWAVAECVTCIQDRADGGDDLPPQDPIVSYVYSLERTLLAPPPLERYGAALSLHAVLRVCGEALLIAVPSLYAHVVCGCMDSNYLVASLFVSVLALVADATDNDELASTIVAYLRTLGAVSENDTDGKYFVRQLSGKEQMPLRDGKVESKPGKGSDSGTATGTGLNSVLRCAVHHCPSVPPQLLLRLANSLRYLPKRMRLQQLGLIRMWATKLRSLDTVLLHKLLPGLRDPDAEVRALYVGVFRELAPTLLSVETSTLSAVESYFRHALERVAASESSVFASFGTHTSEMSSGVGAPNMLVELLGAVAEFPYERLEEAKLQALLELLLHKVLGLTTLVPREARNEVYLFLGRCARFWNSPSLTHFALASLIVCLGEESATCMRSILDAIDAIGNTTDYGKTLCGELLTTLKRVRSELHHQNLVVRMVAYDEFATDLAVRDANTDALGPVLRLLRSSSFLAFIQERFFNELDAGADAALDQDEDPSTVTAGSAVGGDVGGSRKRTSSGVGGELSAQRVTDRGRGSGNGHHAHHPHWVAVLYAMLQSEDEKNGDVIATSPSVEDENKDSVSAEESIKDAIVPTDTNATEGKNSGASLAIDEKRPVMSDNDGTVSINGASSMLRLLTQPLGSDDAMLRHAACVAIYRCCFVGGERVAFRPVEQLLHSAQRHLAASNRLRAESTLSMLGMLIPCKIRGLNRVLLRCFMRQCLTMITTESSATLRRECIELLMALLRARPRGMRPVGLEGLRDALRELFAHPNSELVATAVKAYPLVFHVATTMSEEQSEVNRHGGVGGESGPEIDALGVDGDAAMYYRYLKADFEPVRGKAWEREADPLLAKLSQGQIKVVLHATVDAMGAMRSKDCASLIVDDLLELLRDPDTELRCRVLEAVLTQSTLLPPKARAALRWIVLPLAADPNIRVRLAFSRSARGVSTPSHHYFASLAPDEDDSEADGEASLMPADDATVRAELLGFRPSEGEVTLGPQNVDPDLLKASRDRIIGKGGGDATEGWGGLLSTAPPGWFDAAPAWSVKPSISPKLLAHLRSIADDFCGELDESQMDVVEYHLQGAMQMRGLEGSAALVLSELARRMCAKGHVEQASSMLRTLVLSVSGGEGGNTGGAASSRSALVMGCALGMQNVAEQHPETMVPMLVDNICALAVVHTGDLVAMRQVLGAFREGEERLKGLITASQAQVLVGKLLTSIQSATMPMATKKAALDLIGEVALIAGSREMPSVVKSIIDVLEHTADAAVHEKATSQLSKIFGSLPKSHPLVSSIIAEVDAGLVSFHWNQRQRALTLFVIFSNSMDLSAAISHSARMLADPDRRLRSRALLMLLDNPFPKVETVVRQAIDKLLAAIRKAGVSTSLASPTAGSALDKQVGGVSGMAVTDADIEDDLVLDTEGGGAGGAGGGDANEDGVGAGLTIPLPDPDPLNATFLCEDVKYAAWIEEYGLNAQELIAGGGSKLDPRSPNAAAGDRRHIGDHETKATSGSVASGSKAAGRGVSDAELNALVRMDPVPLIRALVLRDPQKGQQLLDSMLKDIDIGIELLATGLKHIEDSARRPESRADSIEEDFSDDDVEGDDEEDGRRGREEDEHLLAVQRFEALSHNVEVYTTIVRACDGVRSDLAQYLARLQQLVAACAERAGALRSSIFAAMERVALVLPEPVGDQPVVSMKQWKLVDDHRRMLEQAATDSSKREELAMRRKVLQNALSSMNSVLFTISRLHRKAVHGLGTIYNSFGNGTDGSSQSVTKVGTEVILSGFEWLLAQLLSDAHRGLRAVSRNALVQMAKSHVNGNAAFKAHIQRAVERTLRVIEADFEAGEDGAAAEAASAAFEGPGLEGGVHFPLYRVKVDLLYVLSHLVHHCVDPAMRRHVLQLLIDLWDCPDGCVRRIAIEMVMELGRSGLPEMAEYMQAKSSNASSELMVQITKRIKDPNFREKESLNRLLTWYFSSSAVSG